MDFRKTTAICPGKVMIAGEYAVLRGARCIAVTTDHYLSATFEEVPDQDHFEIFSNLWEKPKNISSIRDVDAGDILSIAVLSAEERFDLFHRGRVQIKSSLKIEDGVGSSSALRLATLAAIAGQANDEVLEKGYHLQFSQQNIASGYDFATQYIGGVVLYQKAEAEFNILKSFRNKIGYAEELSPILKIMTGGRGEETTKAVHDTSHWLTKNNKWNDLLEVSDQSVQVIIDWLHQDKVLNDVVVTLAQLRKIFEPAPNFPGHILEICKTDKSFDNEWTFKTTGAGGEDSLLFIGHIPEAILQKLNSIGWKQADFGFADIGLRISES